MRRLAPHLKIASAGVSALVGEPADARALATARAHGLELSGHIARQVDGALVAAHELIIGMDESHRQWLIERNPEVRGRVVLLDHWGANQGIPDPFRQSQSVFEVVYQKIRAGCMAWKERLER